MYSNGFMQVTEVLSPRQVRDGIAYYAGLDHDWSIAEKMTGAITGAIAKAIKTIPIDNVDYHRHLIIGYLTLPLSSPLEPVSSKTLTDGQWIGFSRWQSELLTSGQYTQRRTFPDEVIQILYAVRCALSVGGGSYPLAGYYAMMESRTITDDYFGVESFRADIAKEFPALASLMNGD